MRSLRDVAKERSLKVVEEIAEEASGVDQARRGYASMVQLIGKGGANGILCTDVNRLSRNVVDRAQLDYLIRSGKLKAVQTPAGEVPLDSRSVAIAEFQH